MKVIKKTGEDGKIQLDVTATTSEVSEALNQASMAFCSRMGLSFDPKKTPAQLASERLGIKDLDAVVADQAMEMLVPPAINKHNLAPAFNPVPQPKGLLRRGRTFQFGIEIVPKPRYELSDYGPVSITVDPYTSDEEDIDRQINQMAQQFTTYVTDDPHPIHAGDNCFIKIHCEKDGEVLTGLTTDGRTYSMGKGFMPESFDAGIDGMDVGETRSFKFTGPTLDEQGNEVEEEYDATVTLIEVQKEAVPVINDEWVAKNLPMYKDLAALRADIAKNNDKERRKFYEDYKLNQAATELAKRFEDSIPDEIYEGTMREQQKTLRQQVAASGLTWEQFLEQQGGEQQVSMMMMVGARQQLVQGFALDAYYRHHGLSYTEEDLDEVCFQMNPGNPKLVRKQMEDRGMGYSLREAAERLRACKHLLEHADVTVRETASASQI